MLQQPDGPRYVSTGELPAPSRVQELLDEAFEQFADDRRGETSSVYPALAAVPPDRFGLCVVATIGTVHSAGDPAVPFAIMSVAKPFVFALVADRFGPERVREEVGVNATGLPFNSVAAVERSVGGRKNPMVNAGAIATAGFAPGETADEKWGLPALPSVAVWRTRARTRH
jgi:glutaminase